MPYLRTFAALQGHARRSQVSAVYGVFAVHTASGVPILDALASLFSLLV